MDGISLERVDARIGGGRGYGVVREYSATVLIFITRARRTMPVTISRSTALSARLRKIELQKAQTCARFLSVGSWHGENLVKLNVEKFDKAAPRYH
jgi:hypothetical protein